MTALIDVLTGEPGPIGTTDLPSSRDVAMLDALREFGRLPSDDQVDTRSRIGKDESWQLVGWAERACTWSVRDRDLDVLAAAAAATSLHDPALIDSRDALLVLALVSRACTLVGSSVGTVEERAITMSDEAGGAWLRDNLRPDAALPPTHREVGAGPDFRFERAAVDWNPYVALAHLLDDSPGARMPNPGPTDPHA